MDLSPVADEFIPPGWISLRDAVVRGAKFMCADDLAREFTDAEVKQLVAFGHQYQRAEIAGKRTGMNTHLPVPGRIIVRAADLTWLIEQILGTGLEPFRQPEPLPPIRIDDIELYCWLAISPETANVAVAEFSDTHCDG